MRRLAFVALLAGLILAGSVVSAGADDVTVGQSGWNWGNPQPQGNTLRTVEFAGGRGYAAGDFGTLLRTDDGGRNWRGIPTGITADLSRIRAVDEDTVVIGSGCVLRRSDDGGTTFRRLPFTPSETDCPATVASLYFASPQVGYLVLSDGTVVRTANGGQSFSGRTAVPGTAATNPAGPPATPTDLVFTGENTGFATVRGPSGGVIYRTTDGGNTWFQRATDNNGLANLYFPDPSIGFAVGSNNTVLKTENGGETWENKAVEGDVPNNDLLSVRCATTTSCLFATAGGERVLRTTDGGEIITSVNPSTRKIFAVAFASESSAVGVGERGATVLSTNANAAAPSFVPIGDQPLLGTFNRIRSTSGALVYAPGDNGKLARSVDGGHHWASLQVPTSEDLADAWFVDERFGYVLDSSGKVLKTDDSGDSWSLLDTGTTALPAAIYAIDQNLILLIGPRGILRSTNGGASPFEPVESKPARSATLTDYDRTDGLALFAYGQRRLIVSNDRGATWRRVKDPVKKPVYQKIDFVSGKVGYALMGDGRVFATTNTGKTWSERRGAGTRLGSDISFGDARNGLMTVPFFGAGSAPAGWVLRTSDGGATWRPQLIEPQPLVARGIATPSATTAFALAGGSDLFFTNTGGDAGPGTTLELTATRPRITRARSVKFTGRLSPTVAGARVTVSVRSAKSNNWRVLDTPTVSSTGTFNTAARVTRTSYFVAQWRGDADHNGDGSPVVKVTFAPKRKPRRR